MCDMNNLFLERNLDEEWIEIMKEAYRMGISIKEVKEFLTSNKE
ncbi:anti-repressor SinI family protein [Priestia aryabhattai]